MDANEERVVPLALAHDLDASLSDRVDISRRDREVGSIHRKVLTLATLDGTRREKLLRTAHRIGRMLQVLVSQIEAVHHALATREGHHLRLCDASQPHQLLKVGHPVLVSLQGENCQYHCTEQYV